VSLSESLSAPLWLSTCDTTSWGGAEALLFPLKFTTFIVLIKIPMKNSIKSGLSRATFLLALIAFWPQHLSAQVHYLDIIPDAKIHLSKSPYIANDCSDKHYPLDVNLDDTIDFIIHAKCGYNNDNDDSALISIESAHPTAFFAAGDFVDSLNFNDTIGSSLQWVTGEKVIFYRNNCWNWDREHFTGLRMMDGSSSYYGWLRMIVTFPMYEFTAVIKDLAFQTVPEEAILAGDGLGTFALNIQVADVGDQKNASDIKINFDQAFNEESMVEYRIMVVNATQAEDFNVDSANALTADHYTSVPANGTSHSIKLTSTAISTDGQLITNMINYSVFILSSYENPSENILSYPVPILLQTQTAAVNNILSTDNGNAGNGSDVLISFHKVADEDSISEYRIIVVPMDQMATFDLEMADQVGTDIYTVIVPSGSNISIQLDDQSTDISGETIQEEKGYYVFVLSIADGILSDKNALSEPSNLLALSTPDFLYGGQWNQYYIQYVDIEPDTVVWADYSAGGNRLFDFDLNGDGTNDYQFLCSESGGLGFHSYSSWVEGLNENNKIITTEEHLNWIKILEYGDPVTLLENESAGGVYSYYYYSEWESEWGGYWGGTQDKYTGLIMLQGTDTIMGWVKMSVLGTTTMIIKEYAWMVYSKKVQAHFNYTKTDYQVQFHNHSVSASSFEWDFGDGEHSSEREPLHTYSQESDYVVCLTAVGALGQDTLCENINICEKPTAGFWHELSDWGEISLYNLSEKAERYLWDFGNGDTSEEESPHYTYQEHGTYIITLIAFRGSCSDTINAKTVVCIHPRADFHYTLTNAFVIFFNTSSKSDSVHWDFGDGSGSGVSNPVHTFLSQSNYPVTLHVYNMCGQDSITQIISLSLEDDPNLSGIDLYPVPARDRLMIKPSFPVQKIDVWLCDPSGRLIQAYPDRKAIYPTLELDLSGVKEGIYILKLLLDDRLFMKKIMIMR